jgi:hypothetical protein
MILEPPPFELRAEPSHQSPPRVTPELRGHTQDREPLFARNKPASDDDFLLDKPMARPSASGSPPNGDAARQAANDELMLNNVTQMRRPSSGGPAGPDQKKFDPLFPPEAPARDPAAWRELLNTVEEVPEQRRDRSAGSMIDRLDRAGVRLGGVVSASDLRRIASASHQGERQRRRAIRDVVPGEIQRISRLLENDRDMQVAARTFVNAEAEDALRVLAVSERAREDAHPRLSAYLLLDAALSGAA